MLFGTALKCTQFYTVAQNWAFGYHGYDVSKKASLYSWPQLCKMPTDFQNSFSLDSEVNLQ